MIVKDFIKSVSGKEGFNVTRIRLTPKNRSVYELSGKLNCLLCIHSISHPPYWWGVTDNVIKELRAQTKPWVVVFLYESQETGYLVSSKNVIDNIDNAIWHKAEDGDYKIWGSYLSKNVQFNSLDQFFGQLTSILLNPLK